MAIEEIRRWLNGGHNYERGVQLYCAHGPLETLKAVLRKGKTAENKKKLFEALKKLYYDLKDPEPVAPSQNGKLPSAEVSNLEIPPPAQHQEEYERLDAEWRPFYHEANMLFNRLDLMTNEKERENACLKILELEDQFCAIWKKIDYLKEHGQPMPQQEEISPGEMINHQRRLNNLRTYITKAERNIAKLTGEKLEAKKAQVEQWKAEVGKLEMIVRND